MFGYIKAFKPHMRMCEYDVYKGVYCGLCKTMGKRYGFAYRFSLSYDFTFLAFLSMSLKGESISLKEETCIAHPLKKSQCAKCDSGLNFPSAAAVIAVYHKVRDDKHDIGFKRKVLAFLLLPLLKPGYKKAKKEFPDLAVAVEDAMKSQFQIEDEKNSSIDIACEPTAKIMSAIAKEIAPDSEKAEELARFGYCLGRYVYMCDALDDLESDYKKKNYNALLLQKEITELNEENKKYFEEIARNSINLTLGGLSDSYVELDVEKFKVILDNILYLGLNNTVNQIVNKEKHSERNGHKHGSI